MKAAVISRHGGPEVLELRDLPIPEPGPGQVRVRVRAAALNHLDLWVRRGIPGVTLPHVGGSDMAGEVDAVGPGVEGSPPGTRVVVDPSVDYHWYSGVRSGPALSDPRFRILGEHLNGGFAEYVVVPATNLVEIPTGVDYEVAAAASLVGVTAYRALLVRGGLRPGERVLITGGSGGVATIAVQMAALCGARVFAVTSGPENMARVEALGAHRVYDRLARDVPRAIWQDTRKEGMDLVVDSVGGPDWNRWIRSLAPGGRLVCYGATAGALVETDLRLLFWKQASLLGSTMGNPEEYRAAMGLVFRGEVSPVIHRRFPLEEIRAAHSLLEEGGVFGKVVVLP